MPKTVKWLTETWDELLVYLATFASVIVAPYLGAAAAGTQFNINLKGWTIPVGLVLALFVVALNESKGRDLADDAKTVRAKRDAKRRNIFGRLALCMGNGLTWPNLAGVVFGFLSKAVGS